jgi:hemerythrin-like domain-containing protein
MADSRSKTTDFSKPLQSLKACHDRIRSECDALRGLVTHLRDRGNDEQARQAAAGVVRYFDTAARRHHEDEEQDLLPRMMAAATLGRGASLTRLVADIAGEHRSQERAWSELRGALHEVMAGQSTALDPLAVDRFVKLYQAHFAVEEANVFPLAELLLSKDEFAAIGASMAARRGTDAPRSRFSR